jgi:transcriptional regulator with XRE-family HTH domain
MRPKSKKDDYERLLAQERLILDATEAIVGLLEEQGVSRQELARRLGKSKGFVSQILSGERNMTLRTLADLGYALGRSFSVVPDDTSTSMRNSDALRSLFGAFCTTSNQAQHWIPAETVEERRRAVEDIPVDISHYHEYALAG